MKRKAMKQPCGGGDRRSERGQSLTETALMLPVLMMVLLGAIDLGRAYFAYVSITNAAREGARYGIEQPTAYGTDTVCDTTTNLNTIRGRVCRELYGSGLPVANLQTDVQIGCAAPGVTDPAMFVQGNCASANEGDQIRVTVGYTFRFITTEILGLGSLRMSNYATMSILNGAL